MAKHASTKSAKSAPSRASRSVGNSERSKSARANGKTLAGSALSQLKNPRTGRFVMIDRESGTIIHHKKSTGAYKGVPIAGAAAKRK